jgi:outer membrane lipopolysaccharide assembly protein LptE/RlpB
MRSPLSLILALILAAALAGCGFHLRGGEQQTALQNDVHRAAGDR